LAWAVKRTESPPGRAEYDYHRIFQAISDFSYCRARFKLDESLMICVMRDALLRLWD
jgi:hypothetical protein